MATIDAPHPAASPEPVQLTITYTENEDGWVTAQIVEVPEAISQGPSRHDAWVNVLAALHDLTHEPTIVERVAFTVHARIIEPLSDLPLSGLPDKVAEQLGRLAAAAASHRRDRVS
jgi:hypothetical protein